MVSVVVCNYGRVPRAAVVNLCTECQGPTTLLPDQVSLLCQDCPGFCDFEASKIERSMQKKVLYTV